MEIFAANIEISFTFRIREFTTWAKPNSQCFGKISKFPVFSLTGIFFGFIFRFLCAVGTLIIMIASNLSDNKKQLTWVGCLDFDAMTSKALSSWKAAFTIWAWNKNLHKQSLFSQIIIFKSQCWFFKETITEIIKAYIPLRRRILASGVGVRQ